VRESELFSSELQVCSTLFKALAHPARLVILKYLAETKTCYCLNLKKILELKKVAEKFINDINIPLTFDCK